MITLSQNFISQAITFVPQFSLLQDLVVTLDYNIQTPYSKYEGGFLVGIYDNSGMATNISSSHLTTEDGKILTTEDGLEFVINTDYTISSLFTIHSGYSAGPGLGYSNINNLLGYINTNNTLTGFQPVSGIPNAVLAYDTNGVLHELSSVVGISNGILGIGFDFTGLYATTYTGCSGIDINNFYNTTDLFNTTGPQIYTSEIPVTADGNAFTSTYYFDTYNSYYGYVPPVISIGNAVTVRGPALSGFPLLTTSGNLSSFSVPYYLYGSNTGDHNRIRIRLTDFGNTIIVDMYNFNSKKYNNYLHYTWNCPVSVCGVYFAYYTQLSGQQLNVYNINLNGFFTNLYITSATHIPT